MAKLIGKNAGGTTWSTATNWTVVTGSAPPAAGDVAWFKSAFSSGQPNLTSNVNIAGLYFNGTGTSGYGITRTSPNAFTLTGFATSIGTEVSDSTAVAIGAENTSGTNAISVAIALAPSSGTTSTFFQAAGGTLDLSSSIAVLSGTGITLNLTGTGTMQFGSAASTYSGGTKIAGPTIINTGNATIFGSGTLELNSGTYKTNNTSSRTLSNVLSITGDFTFDSLSTGAIIFSGGGTTTGNRILTMNTVNTSFTTSALTLGGNLTLQGTGSATFSGGLALGGSARIITGNMTGTLTISGGITGTGNVTLDANSAAAITVSTASVNNVGTVTNAGTGAGTTTISGGIGSNVTGIIENSTTSALTVSGPVTVNSGGTTLTNSSGTKLLTLSGGTTGTGNLVLNNNSSTDAGITLSSTSVNNTGTITNSGSGVGNTTISAVIGTNVTGVTENSATSTLLLSGANTYSGPTNLTLGNITLGTSSGLTAGVLTSGPVGTGTFHIGSGTNAAMLSTNASSGTTRTVQNNVSLDGDVTFAPGSGQTTGRIALDVVTNLTTPGTITLTRTNQLTLNTGETVDVIGTISGTGFGLTKLGPGTLNLGNGSATDTAANTYTGLTTVSGGLVNLRKASGTNAIAGDLLIDTTGTVALGNSNEIKDTSALTVNGGGTFDLSGRNEAIDSLNGSGTITNNSTLATTASTLTTGANNGGGTFSGTIPNGSPTKTVALTKTGSGLLLLAGANTYTGDTTIAGGELMLSPLGSLSSASTIRLGDTAANSPSAMFTFGSTSGGISLSDPLIVQASASGTQGTRTILGLATSGNTNTYAGPVTMNADLTVQSAAVGGTVANGQGTLLFQGGSIDVGTSTLTVNTNLRGNNADTYSIQGIVNINEVLGSSQTTGGSLFKDGSGTLILQGTNNTYTGTNAAALNANGTRIGGGILGIFGDGSLGLAPTTAANNVFFVAPGTNVNLDSIAPTLQADANNVVLAATRNINIAGGVTAQFDSNGNTFTVAGNINGAGNLTKIGPGTLALTNANSYTGTTTINSGTLNAAANGALGSGVGGTATGTSSITVNSGGTLMLSNSGATDRVRDDAPITLAGGTIGRSGSGVVSEGAGATRTNGGVPSGTSVVGLGALTLTSNSTLDFNLLNTGGVGTLTFASFSTTSSTLNILNWSSNASFTTQTSGVDGTDDRLIFAGLAAPNTAFITFDGAASGLIALDPGFWEVVPLTPVPEPSTWIGAALALGAIGFTQRRRIRGLLAKS